MVKPEKAKRVEEMLMHAAKSGALGGKVTEDQFIQMLEQVRKTERERSRPHHVPSYRDRKHLWVCSGMKSIFCSLTP